MLVDRLLVKLINEPFESPDFIPEAEQDNIGKKYNMLDINNIKLGVKINVSKKKERNEVLIVIAKIYKFCERICCSKIK